MRPYYLSGNDCTESSQRHIIISVAGRPSRPKRGYPLAESFRLAVVRRFHWRGGRVSQEDTIQFARPQLFWDWLATVLDPKLGTRLWGWGLHASWCLLGGWERVARGEIDCKFLLDNDPPWALAGNWKGRKISALDVQNFLRCSYGDLEAKVLSRPCARPSPSGPAAAWMDWLAEQCHVVCAAVEALLRFHRDNDLGSLGWTAAGLALNAYRHRLGPVVPRGRLYVRPPRTEPARQRRILWPLPHGSAVLRRLERSAHYGGLIVAHRHGPPVADVTTFDVRSQYPAVMASEVYPARLLFVRRGRPLAKLLPLLSEYCCFARVELVSPDRAYPVRRNGKVLLAVGRFWTTLPGPELRVAAELGHVQAVPALYCYQPEPLFREFVKTFWQLRRRYLAHDDRVLAQLCKDLLNNFYGKWLQIGVTWRHDPTKNAVRGWGRYPTFGPEGTATGHVRELGRRVEVEERGVEPSWVFPLIAAYVTSYARLQLERFCSVAGPEHVLYQHADCLHVDREGRKNLERAGLVQPQELGQLQLKDHYDSVEYLGPGAYIADGLPYVCGLPAEAITGDGRHYEYVRQLHCRELFSHPLPRGLDFTAGSVDLNQWRPLGRPQNDGTVWPPVLDEESDPQPEPSWDLDPSDSTA